MPTTSFENSEKSYVLAIAYFLDGSEMGLVHRNANYERKWHLAAKDMHIGTLRRKSCFEKRKNN